MSRIVEARNLRRLVSQYPVSPVAAKEFNYLPAHLNYHENKAVQIYVQDFQKFQFHSRISSINENKLLNITKNEKSKHELTELERKAERENIDFLYNFRDALDANFDSILSLQTCPDSISNFLDDNVKTTIALYDRPKYTNKKLNNDMSTKSMVLDYCYKNKSIIGKPNCLKSLERITTYLNIFYKDPFLKAIYSEPIPSDLQISLRWYFQETSNEILVKSTKRHDFKTIFHFDKNSKKIFSVQTIKAKKVILQSLKNLKLAILRNRVQKVLQKNW